MRSVTAPQRLRIQYGYLKTLPDDYIGPRHVVTVKQRIERRQVRKQSVEYTGAGLDSGKVAAQQKHHSHPRRVPFPDELRFEKSSGDRANCHPN